MSHKLALGTVQFGLDYGVAGGHRVPEADVRHILAHASAAGVDTLDTAAAYGDSETVLGHCLTEHPAFRIVTKIPPLTDQDVSACDLRDRLNRSLERLQVARVYALMMHRAMDLLGEQGDQLYRQLVELRDAGFVERIGVSVYGPDDLDALLARYPMDIVQVPFNVLDQRMLQGDLIPRLQAAGTEIHTRSCFLQGLLLMPGHRIPAYFAPWHSLLEACRHWVEISGASAQSAHLHFALQQPWVDRVVVGVDNAAQFEALLQAAATPLTLHSATHLASEALDLINPARWQR
ncbi:MAG: aldo/keto reductase [Gammaproteobacteria bacterium]|nr:aldo/keto reductase [Gammaproteobacteria bacterium]